MVENKLSKKENRYKPPSAHAIQMLDGDRRQPVSLLVSSRSRVWVSSGWFPNQLLLQCDILI